MITPSLMRLLDVCCLDSNHIIASRLEPDRGNKNTHLHVHVSMSVLGPKCRGPPLSERLHVLLSKRETADLRADWREVTVSAAICRLTGTGCSRVCALASYSLCFHTMLTHHTLSFLFCHHRSERTCRAGRKLGGESDKKKEQCAVSPFSLVFRKDFVDSEQINESDQLFFLTKVSKKSARNEQQ